MKIARSLAELGSPGPSVVTIGNFDGVHCGHRMVIASVLERARLLNASAIAVTFDPHPAHVLHTASRLPLITPLDEKLRLLAETGLDQVLVLPFTDELRHWTARHLPSECCAMRCAPSRSMRAKRFASATRPRPTSPGCRNWGASWALASRRMCRALRAALRSHPAAFACSSAPATCTKRARCWDAPSRSAAHRRRDAVTARATRCRRSNLAPYLELLPAHGVYVTTLRVGDGRVFRGVTNVGNRPTFGADSFAVESHLIDFEPVDLLETPPLELTFLRRLRDERRFESTEALRDQIGRDVRQALRFFALSDALNVHRNALTS